MLKTSTTPIVDIFKQICCFDEVFLMVLKSAEHLFTERPLSGLQRVGNLGTHFFVHLITCLHIGLCTSNFASLE